MPEHETPQQAGLVGTLTQLIKRLRSQPLVFALGVLLVLAIAATVAIDALRALTVPAVVIFALGLLAWLAVELPKAVSRRRTGTTVHVRARDVGASGRVSGIEGLPPSASPPSVTADAERIDGSVTGARYGTSAADDTSRR